VDQQFNSLAEHLDARRKVLNFLKAAKEVEALMLEALEECDFTALAEKFGLAVPPIGYVQVMFSWIDLRRLEVTVMITNTDEKLAESYQVTVSNPQAGVKANVPHKVMEVDPGREAQTTFTLEFPEAYSRTSQLVVKVSGCFDPSQDLKYAMPSKPAEMVRQAQKQAQPQVVSPN
jgi:hypothetical protein